MTTTQRAPAPTDIVFGTDGWRARIADEYTFENVRRCADGVAHYVAERGETAKGVVIAYDRRFASEHFAAAAAEVVLAHDIPVAFASQAVPTQMSSYEVVQRGSAAGIVITASHNPWVDNGFKVKAPTGAAGGPTCSPASRRGSRSTAASRSTAGRSRTPRRPASSSASTRTTGYEGFVRRTVDLDALKAADVSVLVDPMWGAGAGWISAAARRRAHPRRRDPPGAQPVLRRGQPRADPAQHRRGPRDLAGGGYDLGLLLDGDADRAGAADERGTFIHQLQVTGLLMYYLAEHRGWRDPVVVSVNNTSMAARLGEHYGIKTSRRRSGSSSSGRR